MKKNDNEFGEGYRKYVERVGKAPLLTREQEIELFILYKERAGEEKLLAKHKLMTHNLRLVLHWALKYKDNDLCLPIDDLIQEGCIGLNRAVEKFDLDRGVKFSTYASLWIKQAIGKAIEAKSRLIRLPVYQYQFIRRFYRERHQRPELTIQSFALECGVSESYSEAAFTASHGCTSLNTPAREAEVETEIIELLGSPSDVEAMVAQKILNEDCEILLKNIKPHWAQILRLRFGLATGTPQSLQEISKQVHLSRERVNQIIKLAINEIKEKIDEDESRCRSLRAN